MMYEPIVSYNDVDINDRPRLLTSSELTDIVGVLPEFPCPHKKMAEIYRYQVQGHLIKDFEGVELSPSMIPVMKATIVEYHMNSLNDRGTPIGLQAAEAYAAILTQMILNAFHKSGGAEASQGLDGVKDLTYARQNTSDPKVFTYFKDPAVTMEQIITVYRRKMVGLTVKDLIERSESFPINELEVPWWMDSYPPSTAHAYLRVKFNLKKMYQSRVTMKMIKSAIMLGTGNSSNVKCFYSSNRIAELIVFLISDSQDITNFIATCNDINTSCASRLKVKPLPVNFVNQSADKDDINIFLVAEMTLLESVITRSFACIRVQGIQGIMSLQPVKMKGTIMALVEQVRVNERQWILTLNSEKSRETGVVIEKVILLLEDCKFQVSRSNGDLNKILVNCPETCYMDPFKGGMMAKSEEGNYFKLIPDYDSQLNQGMYVLKNGYTYKLLTTDDIKFEEGVWVQQISKDSYLERSDVVTTSEGIYIPVSIVEVDGEKYEVMPSGVTSVEMKPSEIIDNRIGIDKAKFARESQKDKLAKRSDLINHSMHVYGIAKIDLKAKNKNLYKQVLCLPYIDKKRTFVNHMHLLANTHGIENADYYIYSTFTNTLAARDAYVNSSMTTIITDSISNRGVLYGATFNGISRQTAGHMSLSSVEKAGDVMISAAIAGQKEDLRNTTAATYLGVRPSVGTGAFHVSQIIVENGVQRLVIDDELFTVKDDREKELIEAMNTRAMEISQRLHEQLRSDDFAVQNTVKKLDEDNMINSAYSSNYERYSTAPTYDNVIVQGPPVNVRPPVGGFGIFTPDVDLERTLRTSRVMSNRGSLTGQLFGRPTSIGQQAVQGIQPVVQQVRQSPRQSQRVSAGRTSARTSARVSAGANAAGSRARSSPDQSSRPQNDDDDFVLEDFEPGVYQANTQEAQIDIDALDSIFG